MKKIIKNYVFLLLFTLVIASFAICFLLFIDNKSNQAKAEDVSSVTLTADVVGEIRPYSSGEKTWYFNLHFAGFSTTGYDAYNGTNVTDYILFNGESVSNINANTSNYSSWTWAKFPQNAIESFAKPVLNYVETSGILNMQVHENLFNSLKDTYGLVEVTICHGLSVGGYTLTADQVFILNKNNTFVSYNDSSVIKVPSSNISVSRWQPVGDVYYFDVNFPAFPSGVDYHVMDNDSI